MTAYQPVSLKKADTQDGWKIHAKKMKKTTFSIQQVQQKTAQEPFPTSAASPFPLSRISAPYGLGTLVGRASISLN